MFKKILMITSLVVAFAACGTKTTEEAKPAETMTETVVPAEATKAMETITEKAVEAVEATAETTVEVVETTAETMTEKVGEAADKVKDMVVPTETKPAN
ncbi:MAG: hypothetical protein ACRC0V_04725 [Fusobacteriaceae bacterium]